MKKEIWDAVAGIDERFILEAAEVQRQPDRKMNLPESGSKKLRATTRRWSWGKAAVIVFCLGLTAAGVALLLRLAPWSSGGQKPGSAIPPATAINGATQEPHTAETADPALEAEIQAALAAKEPKQIWAENFITETRKEATIWRFTSLDCTALYSELQELLFPDVSKAKKISNPDGSFQMQLKQGRTTIICNCDSVSINILGITSKEAKELFSKAVDWYAEKTGLKLQEWTGYDMARIRNYRVFSGSVDGISIGEMTYNRIGNNRLDTGHGVMLNNFGLDIWMPIIVGEAVRTVRLDDLFSPEEIRMTAEFIFNPAAPVIEVYRSCELSYLIDEQKGLLIPVWWVKGTKYNYETGKEAAFEMVFDAESGGLYAFEGV